MNFSELKNIELSDIDFNDMAKWSILLKSIFCLFLLLIILIFGYLFYITDLQQSYKKQFAKEKDLKNQLSQKYIQSSNLIAYREQMKQIKNMFEGLLKQLPGDTEVPGLLDDISNIGQNAGLQFEFIKLQPEKAKEYYIELPISIAIKGNYHDLGNFVSGVASLSRIVTLHDFKISHTPDQQLKMEVLAKTYRYNDEGELK